MFKNFEQPLFRADPENPGLLQLALEGRAVLPEFQREWIWQPNRVVSLIHSIARGWPAGSLLLMDGTRNFPSRPLQGVNKVAKKNAEYSILDGQQRLTALLQAYFDLHKSHVFFVRLAEMVEKGEIEEDHFEAMTRSKWVAKKSQYDKLKNAADEGFILLSDVLDDNRFEDWLAFRPEEEDRGAYRQFRGDRLQNLKTYAFHSSVIDKDASAEVLTAVFSTINQQGVALNTFDLMVAISWQQPGRGKKGYHLRDEWERAAVYGDVPPKFPRIANFGVKAIVALRLVKLMKSVEGSVSDAEILRRIKGSDVRGKFGDALVAIDAGLKFLHEHCAVLPETLPHEGSLLPISLVLHRHPEIKRSKDKRERLKEWFWGSSFLQRYGRGGTNTRVVSDADELETWIADGNEKPQWLANFWTSFERGTLVETETGNGMLLGALMSLQNDAGALDWKTDEAIRNLGRQPREGSVEASSVLQRHHVYPKDIELSSKGQGSLKSGELFDNSHDLLVNRVLIRSETNSNLQATPPSSVNKRGCDWDSVESHLIDRTTLKAWPKFVEARVAAIEAALEERIPRPE